jgi:predicted phosphodiesterase
MADPLKQQELVNKLRELALDLGRTPHWHEITKIVSTTQIYKHFGGLPVFIQAAGLDPAPKTKAKKIDNSIFNVDVETRLKEYEESGQPDPYVFKKTDAKIALISDIHFPWANKKVLEKFYEFIEEHQPDFVIINGDAWDMYAYSKYPRSHNLYSPRDEQSIARKMNEEFWDKVQSLCKNAKCIQMLGNHCIRPLKRVLEEYPEAEDWIAEKLKELFTFKNVLTVHDHRQEVIINEDCIFHGYRSQLGAHRDYTHMNCHNGHSHVGGTVFRRIKGKTLFECNSGVAGDIDSKALSYTSQKITHQTPGFSYRDKYGPRFIAV